MGRRPDGKRDGRLLKWSTEIAPQTQSRRHKDGRCIREAETADADRLVRAAVRGVTGRPRDEVGRGDRGAGRVVRGTCCARAHPQGLGSGIHDGSYRPLAGVGTGADALCPAIGQAPTGCPSDPRGHRRQMGKGFDLAFAESSTSTGGPQHSVSA